MGKRVPGHAKIKREKNRLYYVDKQGYISSTSANRSGRKKKK